jgi:hypothetical protein
MHGAADESLAAAIWADLASTGNRLANAIYRNAGYFLK